MPPDVVAGWSGEPGVTAYVLVEDDRPVAYGEVWVDDDEAEVELARLVVDPRHRGAGVGRRLVGALIGEAVASYPVVVVRVHPDNAAALRCYAAAGFGPVPPVEQAQWDAGQPSAYTWMTLAR